MLPMSLDEYQVAQLYMIQVRAVGSRRPRRGVGGGMLHVWCPQERVGRTWDQGPGPAQSPCSPALGLGRAQARGGERASPVGCGGGVVVVKVCGKSGGRA